MTPGKWTQVHFGTVRTTMAALTKTTRSRRRISVEMSRSVRGHRKQTNCSYRFGDR